MEQTTNQTNKSPEPNVFIENQNESVLKKILLFVPRLFINIAGFFAGILDAFRNIKKENKEAANYESNKSDKEAFASEEDIINEQKEQELDKVEQDIKRLYPEANIDREELNQLIEQVKEIEIPIDLMEQYNIPYTIALGKERDIIILSNNILEQSKDTLDKFNQVCKEHEHILSEDSLTILEQKFQEAIEDQRTITINSGDYTVVFNGCTGEYKINEKNIQPEQESDIQSEESLNTQLEQEPDIQSNKKSPIKNKEDFER